MKRLLAGAALGALALASGTALAQSQDEGVVVSRDLVDPFVTGSELEVSGTIAEGECVPTSDEEYMRTGVETICAERGGPIRTIILRNSSPTPTPAASRPRRTQTSTTPSRPRSRPAPRPRPTVVRIPDRCAPTDSTALNMCLTFGLGSSDLTQNARNQIRVFAESMIENESTETFIIAGHTDTTGEAARNCELSQLRADSVVAYMVELGVSSDQLRPVGFGQDRLQAGISETDPRHRRVEIVRGDADEASSQACSIASAETAEADPA